MTLRSFFFMIRHKRACRELQKLVEANKRKFETQDFAKRRAAALKRVPKVWA
jgi:hypothetical protein